MSISGPRADRPTGPRPPHPATGVRHPHSAGGVLRHWRERRRLSQLELSNQAEVSTRHLSFVETGRAAPSRDMLLRLAESLDMPLRERNALLLAGGFAPVYPETEVDAPAMSGVRRALAQVLRAHEPFPAVVVDRHWDLVDANRSVALLTALADEELLRPPVNVLRLSLSPDGLAPAIVNLGEWRAHLLSRLHRQVDFSGDAELRALLEELRAFPCDQPEPEVEMPGPGEVVLPLRLCPPGGGPTLSFFSTVSTFGTPLDVTVAELVLEQFFPADDVTADALRDGMSFGVQPHVGDGAG